ncbi:hypothetical protein MK805_17085 [Shimazuella sp. AN120528]|nr:hypothetical protein [Shimazuella soli]
MAESGVFLFTFKEEEGVLRFVVPDEEEYLTPTELDFESEGERFTKLLASQVSQKDLYKERVKSYLLTLKRNNIKASSMTVRCTLLLRTRVKSPSSHIWKQRNSRRTSDLPSTLGTWFWVHRSSRSTCCWGWTNRIPCDPSNLAIYRKQLYNKKVTTYAHRVTFLF